MPASTWTEADTARAKEIWAEYQKQHDVSARKGQAVGIDPASGRVWFGESAKDIWRQMEAEGLESPLYVLRVGYDYYVRKGGHGCTVTLQWSPVPRQPSGYALAHG